MRTTVKPYFSWFHVCVPECPIPSLCLLPSPGFLLTSSSLSIQTLSILPNLQESFLAFQLQVRGHFHFPHCLRRVPAVFLYPWPRVSTRCGWVCGAYILQCLSTSRGRMWILFDSESVTAVVHRGHLTWGEDSLCTLCLHCKTTLLLVIIIKNE